MSDARRLWCCSRCLAIYRKEFPFCPADGGEVIVTDTDPLIGQDLEHYTIGELIGEGAMGRVYRAHHKHLPDRHYAIKVLSGDMAATQEMRMRFVNEAKSASKLSHPNVVSVLDVGRSPAGLLYLVMELVDGTPLSKIDMPMDPERAARIIRDVCIGLGHAHAKGLVHRDLKPENILVVTTGDGELARVVDFGIAIQIERTDVRLTATGMTLGTPGYIAPEQVTGIVVDGRADQYSVGATFFEMLTGTLPFSGVPTEVVNAKARFDAPSLEASMPPGTTAPPVLVRIVDRMLSRKPDQRYESIGDVARMLTRWIEAPTTEFLPDPPNRRRKITLAVAVAATAVLAAGGALAYELAGPRDAAPVVAAPGARPSSGTTPIAMASGATPSGATSSSTTPASTTPVATASGATPSGATSSSATPASTTPVATASGATPSGATIAGTPSSTPSGAPIAGAPSSTPSKAPITGTPSSTTSGAPTAGGPSTDEAAIGDVTSDDVGSRSRSRGHRRHGHKTSIATADKAKNEDKGKDRPTTTTATSRDVPTTTGTTTTGTTTTGTTTTGTTTTGTTTTGTTTTGTTTGTTTTGTTTTSTPSQAVATRSSPPSQLAARLLDVSVVTGSLSPADVRRAVNRIAPAIGRCTAPNPQTAQVRFTIGESRRAQSIQGSGVPASALACLTAAFGSVRTESAPDVGDAEVVVRIGFQGPS